MRSSKQAGNLPRSPPLPRAGQLKAVPKGDPGLKGRPTHCPPWNRSGRDSSAVITRAHRGERFRAAALRTREKNQIGRR